MNEAIVYNPIREAEAAELEATDKMRRALRLRNERPLDLEAQRAFLDAYRAYREAVERVLGCMRITEL